MTVCIAAIASYGQSIVIVTDQMLTMGFTKADEAALKIQGIHSNWAVMYAGSVEHVAPLLRSARKELAVIDSRDPTYEEVEQAVVKAYQERLRQEETNTVLSQFGMTIDDFTASGPVKFGDTIFSQLFSEIRQVTLGQSPGLSLLIAGYDGEGGRTSLLSVILGRHKITTFKVSGPSALVNMVRLAVSFSIRITSGSCESRPSTTSQRPSSWRKNLPTLVRIPAFCCLNGNLPAWG